MSPHHSLSLSHHQNPNPNLLLPLHHSHAAGIPHGRHEPVRPPLLTPERSHHDALTQENPVTAAAPVVRDCIVFSARPAATTMPGLHSPTMDCIHEHEPPHPLLPRAIVKMQTPLLPSEFAPVSIATPSSRLRRDVATYALQELEPVTFALSSSLYCASIAPTSPPPAS